MHLLAVLAFCATLTIAQNVTYDYVIAGAGTAGLLLATILSENPNITVLVLEAGADGRTNPNITNPELRGTIQGTQYDWAFRTTPQPYFYANGTQGSQMVPRGKTLGGTAAMNWMIHNTDSRVQLDIWESLLNLTGWNWQSMSTAFRESETMYDPPANMSQYFPYNAGCHGGTGPIYSTFQRSVMSLIPQYLQPSLQAAGFKASEDSYCGDAVGPNFFALAINPFNYTRSYSGSVYSTVEYRSNLHVQTNAQVTRINWSTTTGNVTASGLSYVDRSGASNTTQSVNARQVILSAGCIQSSQILELSGVGDPSVLRPLGIQPVINLSNVGVGLRDPPMTNYWPLSFNINTTLTGTDFSQNFIQLESASKVLTPADYTAASTWLNSTSSIPGLPDAQLQVFKTLWYTEQPLIEFAWQYTTQNVTPYNLIPLSQGTVHINSSNPLSPPAINPNYNSVNATINGTTVAWDMWFLAKAAQYYQTKLATTAPMSSIVQSTVPDYRLPFAQYYDEIFRATGTSEHLTGGNPMLARAAGGVVDTSLLVYGTTNVRVVDGSVFPYQPSAHPMGVIYALAVRAARILQGLQGGGGLTRTEQLPASNSSANATASFGIIPTATSSGLASSNDAISVARGVAYLVSVAGALAAGTAIMML